MAYIEFRHGGVWRIDSRAGTFANATDALAYVQSHAKRYQDTPLLRIQTTLYLVRGGGIETMTARRGWQPVLTATGQGS